MFIKKIKFSILIIPLLLVTTACINQATAPGPDEEATNTEPMAQEEPAVNTVQAYLRFVVAGQDDPIYGETLEAETGVDLLTLMQTLNNEDRIQMVVNGEGDMAFVESLDGMAGDAATNKYWMLYVNDDLATVGAGAYIIQNGDFIEWRYQDTTDISL